MHHTPRPQRSPFLMNPQMNSFLLGICLFSRPLLTAPPLPPPCLLFLTPLSALSLLLLLLLTGGSLESDLSLELLRRRRLCLTLALILTLSWCGGLLLFGGVGGDDGGRELVLTPGRSFTGGPEVSTFFLTSVAAS